MSLRLCLAETFIVHAKISYNLDQKWQKHVQDQDLPSTRSFSGILLFWWVCVGPRVLTALGFLGTPRGNPSNREGRRFIAPFTLSTDNRPKLRRRMPAALSLSLLGFTPRRHESTWWATSHTEPAACASQSYVFLLACEIGLVTMHFSQCSIGFVQSRHRL